MNVFLYYFLSVTIRLSHRLPGASLYFDKDGGKFNFVCVCVHVCVLAVEAEKMYLQWCVKCDQYSVWRVQGSSYREIHIFDMNL